MQNQIRIVGTFAYKDGKYVSINKNREDFANGKAIRIPPDQINNYYPLRSNSRITVGGSLNYITLKAGETYFVKSGRRVVVEATNERVIIVQAFNRKQLPEFFIQTPSGFHQEWLDLIRSKTGQRLGSTQILAEWEVQFLVGLVAGTGWKGLTLVIGIDLFEEAVTGKKTQATKNAIRMLQVLLKFHRELNEVAPTLASVIADFIWLSLLKGQKQYLLPAMVSDPKVAARAAGTIAGQIGKQAFNRRLTISAFLWTVFSQVGTKALVSIPAAISDTIKSFEAIDMNASVEKVDEVLRTIDIVLTKQELMAIISEIESNPEKIRNIFKSMLDELKVPPK